MEDSACQVLSTDADDVLQPVPEHPVKSCKAKFLFKQGFFLAPILPNNLVGMSFKMNYKILDKFINAIVKSSTKPYIIYRTDRIKMMID